MDDAALDRIDFALESTFRAVKGAELNQRAHDEFDAFRQIRREHAELTAEVERFIALTAFMREEWMLTEAALIRRANLNLKHNEWVPGEAEKRVAVKVDAWERARKEAQGG